MFKNHSVHIIATYALLILASPLLATSIASAQAINCPTGYICTPVNPNNTAAEVPRVAGGGTVDSSAPCSVSLSSNLTTGSRGVEVIALQSFLISRGHSIASIASGDAPKGYFGTQTMSAVRQFQQASGIPVTGFVGSETRAKILADCGSSTVQQAEQNSSMSVRDSRPLVCGSRGDLDGNKIITREDYDLLGKAVAGLMAVSLDIGDLNGDSSITVSDWVLLGNYIAGTVTSFSGCSGRTSSSGGEQNQSMNAAIWDAISEYLKNHPQ